MHPEFNKSRHQQGLHMSVSACEKHNARTLSAYFT